MLARTRDDVDQLNALAKTAAQAAGDSHGPQLVVGEKSFQAGDVIRTKRNNRAITLGETHVRNGDRYTILATTEDGGLLVDDLTGRGSTMLPAALRRRACRARLGHHHRRRARRHHRHRDPARATRHRPRTPLRRTHPRTRRKPRLCRARQSTRTTSTHPQATPAHERCSRPPSRAAAATTPPTPCSTAPTPPTDPHCQCHRRQRSRRSQSEEAAARSRRLATQEVIDQHRSAERRTGRGIGI